MNSIYSKLSSVKFIGKSYNYKFLFIAFLGIHIPLIGLIVFITSKPQTISPLSIFLLTLLLTLIATALTLFMLHSLLEPLSASQRALDKYLVDRELPELPEHFEDEAGLLMKSIQRTIVSLDNLLKEKRDFVSLLSHDLRMPLANIRLLSQYIEKTEVMENAQRKEIGGLISASVNEQMELFQKVLDMLRNDEVRAMELNKERMCIQQLVKEAVDELKAMADNKNISINLSIPENITVDVDIKLLSQVIKNLVNNAIKFSHRYSEIDIYLTLLPNKKVRVSVEDSGVGFNPGDSEKLFDRFSKLSHAGTENELSTGMGLYLSKKIVEAHNGILTAESQGISKGAVFAVVI